MNSAESSFPTQTSLLLPYHQQTYLFNSRQDLDLLALSQTDLANQLKSYSSIHNPHPFLTLNSLPQKESPEKSLLAHAARSLPNGQMSTFLGISHPSAHDPFSNRLHPSQISNPLAKQLEDPIGVATKLNFDNRIPYNPTNQLNSIAQLLEANDLKAQAQKNMQELLFYQMQGAAQLQSTGSLGYSVLMNPQNSLNYGGLLQNQAFFGGQIPTEMLSKKQMETQKALYGQIGLSGLEGIVSQDSENLLRNVKMTGKSMEELNLMSNEQIAPYCTPKQLVRQEQSGSQGKAKQVVQEIVIQDLDTPPQKENKDTMQVEASNAMEDLSTVSCVESQSEIKKKDKEKEKEKTRKCFNRLCLTDPVNDSLWSAQKVKNSTVCKTCCDAFNKGQYCHYCQQIYLDDETSATSDDKDWIECESCKIWNHIECETIHGLKNLRVLLNKNSCYKYFCPNCRPAKTLKVPVKSTKGQGKAVSQSKSNSPLNLTETDSQKTPVHHPKPSLDDSLINEEGLGEPMIRKFKLQDGLRTEVRPVENTVENVQEDLAKKKLDHVFNKHQINKKRMQGRMVSSNAVPENFSFIDKLMGQFGKKLQLSEGEIRSDLDLFRELSNQTEQQCKEWRVLISKRDEESSVGGESGIKEPVNSGFKRNLNNNKGGKKGQKGNKLLVEDNDALERDSENEGYSAGRVLRNRRRNE